MERDDVVASSLDAEITSLRTEGLGLEEEVRCLELRAAAAAERRAELEGELRQAELELELWRREEALQDRVHGAMLGLLVGHAVGAGRAARRRLMVELVKLLLACMLEARGCGFLPTFAAQFRCRVEGTPTAGAHDAWLHWVRGKQPTAGDARGDGPGIPPAGVLLFVLPVLLLAIAQNPCCTHPPAATAEGVAQLVAELLGGAAASAAAARSSAVTNAWCTQLWMVLQPLLCGARPPSLICQDHCPLPLGQQDQDQHQHQQLDPCTELLRSLGALASSAEPSSPPLMPSTGSAREGRSSAPVAAAEAEGGTEWHTTFGGGWTAAVFKGAVAADASGNRGWVRAWATEDKAVRAALVGALLGCIGGVGAVSRVFPSLTRSMLAEIYLCHACSGLSKVMMETPGQVPRQELRALPREDAALAVAFAKLCSGAAAATAGAQTPL
jgi:hypothetical protein